MKYYNYLDMSSFILAYRLCQVPSAFIIGNWTRNEYKQTKEPEFIANVSAVTCGIICSFVWPLIPVVYGYNEYKNNTNFIKN